MSSYHVIDFNDTHVANSSRALGGTSRAVAKAIARRRVNDEGFVRAMVIERTADSSRVIYDVRDLGVLEVRANRSARI